MDMSRTETREDVALIEKYKQKKILLIFNKIDLPWKMDPAKIRNRYRDLPSLEISALKGTNLIHLKNKIYEIFVPKLKDGEDVIFHFRQKLLIEEILDHLENGRKLLESGFPEEIYAEEIRKIVPAVGRLIGEIHTDDVIEDIFSRFCVGK
jgi:tRNA modification GTPase